MCTCVLLVETSCIGKQQTNKQTTTNIQANGQTSRQTNKQTNNNRQLKRTAVVCLEYTNTRQTSCLNNKQTNKHSILSSLQLPHRSGREPTKNEQGLLRDTAESGGHR